MIISIQPLSQGAPNGPAVRTDFVSFLMRNDGFTIEQAARMRDILAMGSGYLMGANEYRISRVDSNTWDG